MKVTFTIKIISATALAAAIGIPALGATSTHIELKIRERTASVESKLIAWRRDIHQHPELGDQAC
ncbi:MAG: hypothetical protein WBO24_10310 [Nitrospirales bacterium]